MNKNAIKKVAIAARNRLIATVSDRAGMLGITKEKISQPVSKGHGFEIYETAAGTENTLNLTQIEQRRKLVDQIEASGFDVVMEEVAYTWFNRICAIRFMEVNDYLPTRVRVLSSLKEGKNEPDFLTEAPNVDLDFTEEEREWILTAKEQNRLDELFSMLFIKQCNKLSKILPELFEATEDYTEMLLSLSYTNKDDVVRMLVDGIDEADFNITTKDESGNPVGQVEIIGWLYQYYNTELKDDTFAKLKKNIKISKERIPAATQLFTPHWIVRYMVENSVGRIWIEHLRAIDPDTDEKVAAERFGWKYYLPEAEQEPEVNARLSEIRRSGVDLKPMDILCIDPCMGSGHIIMAQFDVLMDIYTSVGYGEREAAFEIIEHNLHGLDIDKRSYQLAYFAVMMKGRQYNRRFFKGKDQDDVPPRPKVYAFVESNEIKQGQLKYFGLGLNELEKNNALNQMSGLLDTFKDAREYGSILNVDNYDWALLRRFAAGLDDLGQMHFDSTGLDQAQKTMEKIIDLGEVMAKKYDAVVTNPPYMNNGGMNSMLQQYLKENYFFEKADLYSVFISRAYKLAKPKGYVAMITQQGWMFLSSFVEFRKHLIVERIILNLLQMGAHAFDELQGEVVLTVSFVSRNVSIDNHEGVYINLQKGTNESEKKAGFFLQEKVFNRSLSVFSKVPNCVFAYDASLMALKRYQDGKYLNKYVTAKPGMQTSDNERFLRLWFEVSVCKIGRELSKDDAIRSEYKWFPYNKGIGYKKWYGNNAYIVNFYNDGEELKYWLTHNPRDPKTKHWSRNMRNYDCYFKNGITFTSIGEKFSARLNGKGYIFDTNGPTLFGSNLEFVCGFVNSVVFDYYNKILCKQITKTIDSVNLVPLIEFEDFVKQNVEKCVLEIVNISKQDWDSFEVSWDFKRHPMVAAEDMLRRESIDVVVDRLVSGAPIEKPSCIMEACFRVWNGQCNSRFNNLKMNEEKLNRIFIDTYGLKDELSPDVEDKDITVRKADLDRDIRSLISYAVGCMFGRYSIDVEGLVYAGGEWDSSKYISFLPDKDNIIPITDEEYFEDDVVGLFCVWLKKVYGADTLEDNLDFIARALGNKGDSSREVIRNYFLNGFFKDHCNTYSVTGSGKRPIYWLFDSGKQNGFKALIYLHRYEQDTVGRIRTDYLHKTQKAIEQAMAGAQYTLENSKSGTEKSKATRRISRYTKQLAEIQLYDQAIAHIANKRIVLDLDDGVKANYAKFQGVEVAREGMKTVKVDLLARI